MAATAGGRGLFYAGTGIEASKRGERKEANVTDNSRAIAATVAGAVLGGLAGYILFTEQGRSLRQRIERALDDFAREINSFEGTVHKAADTANQGWRAVTSAVGNRGEEPPDSLIH
jgi:hypothetical protein